jgi:oligopeptidase A
MDDRSTAAAPRPACRFRSYLTCNLPAPVGQERNATALFTHDDVITVFHEFGHGLHHMLTQVRCWRVGHRGRRMGRGRASQPVHGELRWEDARHMTAHVDTGEPLPREFFDKMIAAKNL